MKKGSIVVLRKSKDEDEVWGITNHDGPKEYDGLKFGWVGLNSPGAFKVSEPFFYVSYEEDLRSMFHATEETGGFFSIADLDPMPLIPIIPPWLNGEDWDEEDEK